MQIDFVTCLPRVTIICAWWFTLAAYVVTHPECMKKNEINKNEINNIIPAVIMHINKRFYLSTLRHLTKANVINHHRITTDWSVQNTYFNDMYSILCLC